jgi:hypothetical protein
MAEVGRLEIGTEANNNKIHKNTAKLLKHNYKQSLRLH